MLEKEVMMKSLKNFLEKDVLTEEDKNQIIRLVAGEKPVMLNIDLSGNCVIRNSFEHGLLIENNRFTVSDK